MGTPPQYPIGLDHRRVRPQIGLNRLQTGEIRAERLENHPLKEFAILIVALAILIDAEHIRKRIGARSIAAHNRRHGKAGQRPSALTAQEAT